MLIDIYIRVFFLWIANFESLLLSHITFSFVAMQPIGCKVNELKFRIYDNCHLQPSPEAANIHNRWWPSEASEPAVSRSMYLLVLVRGRTSAIRQFFCICSPPMGTSLYIRSEPQASLAKLAQPAVMDIRRLRRRLLAKRPTHKTACCSFGDIVPNSCSRHLSS